MFCGECGNPVRPGDRSCPTCRALLPDSSAPVTALGAVSAPDRPTGTMPAVRRPGRGRVLVAAVLSVVAAMAGGGVAYALLDGEDTSTGAERSDVTDSSPSTPSEEDTEPDDGGDTAGATPDNEVATQPIRCWDQERGDDPVTSLAECGWPQGQQGMLWVFARIAGCQDETGTLRSDPIVEDPTLNRALSADCFVRVGERLVRVHYSGWRRWGPMERYYRNLEGVPMTDPTGRTDVVVTQVESPAADFNVALNNRNRLAPRSVTIYTDTEADFQRVYNHLIMRREGFLRGVPERKP